MAAVCGLGEEVVGRCLPGPYDNWRTRYVDFRNALLASLGTWADINSHRPVSGYGALSQWFLPNPVPVTIAHWGQCIFVISLAANIIITAAIAIRIWYAPYMQYV